MQAIDLFRLVKAKANGHEATLLAARYRRLEREGRINTTEGLLDSEFWNWVVPKAKLSPDQRRDLSNWRPTVTALFDQGYRVLLVLDPARRQVKELLFVKPDMNNPTHMKGGRATWSAGQRQFVMQ